MTNIKATRRRVRVAVSFMYDTFKISDMLVNR